MIFERIQRDINFIKYNNIRNMTLSNERENKI